MTYTRIEQGSGYYLGIDDEAHTTVPYASYARENGDQNHGFMDLADRPELVASVPEAQRSEGLQRLLQSVNAKGSRFRTLGCECGLFMRDAHAAGRETADRYIGSYISIVFRDSAMNTADRIEQLARRAVALVAVEDTSHKITYEMTVTPLRALFGQTGCFELHVNALGFGNSDEEAWAAFGTACKGFAHAFDCINELPEEDPLFA